MDAWDSLHPVKSDAERDTRTLKLCALRETFEECGMLLEDGVRDLRDRRAWRDRVHANGNDFIELAKSRNSRLLIEDLTPFSRWITPRFRPKRWDTFFFAVILEPGFAKAAIRASADGSETVQAVWLAPDEAIRRGLLPTTDPDAIELHPPQFFQLAELAQHRSWRSLKDGPLHKRTVVPCEPSLYIDENEHAAMTYPGDAKYELPLPEVDGVSWPSSSATPNDPAALSSIKLHFRHRTNITVPIKTMRVTGCERRGLAELLGPAYNDFEVNVLRSKM